MGLARGPLPLRGDAVPVGVPDCQPGGALGKAGFMFLVTIEKALHGDGSKSGGNNAVKEGGSVGERAIVSRRSSSSRGPNEGAAGGIGNVYAPPHAL